MPDVLTKYLDQLRRVPWLMYGILVFSAGIAMYIFGVLMVFPRYLLGLNAVLMPINEWIVWYSGMPVLTGILLGLGDLFLLLGGKRTKEPVRFERLGDPKVTVVLTAYNDAGSIGDAVADFRAHPKVLRVIVVSNNSTDDTVAVSRAAGAIVFNEERPGYGRCVHRCFTEALGYGDTELIVLCEGDMTFRAFDIDKLLAYAPHADIVNGTRTVERLRQYRTQLSTFMYYGNLYVAKLLEAKHLGRGTFTDVGTTYKLCRSGPLKALLPHLNGAVNLEFNAHFLDTALRQGLTIVECPITFHPRVGVSKGGNTSNRRALRVGSRMALGLVLGWPPVDEKA
jgi:hypothetical protein